MLVFACLTALSLLPKVAGLFADHEDTNHSQSGSRHQQWGEFQQVPLATGKQNIQEDERVTDLIYDSAKITPGKFRGTGVTGPDMKTVTRKNAKRLAWRDSSGFHAVADYIEYPKETLTGNGILLRSLAVDPTNQKRGLGTKLVEELKKRHPDGIFAAAVPAAYEFWKRKGFGCIQHVEKFCEQETSNTNRIRLGIMQGQADVKKKRLRKLYEIFQNSDSAGGDLIAIAWASNFTLL